MNLDKEQSEKTLGGCAVGPSCRESAQGVLNRQIERAEKHLLGLIALRDSIPWKSISHMNEEALWILLTTKQF